MSFERGVSTFPLPQQKVYLTPKSELPRIFGQGGPAGIEIGEHVGAGGTPCYADMNELLGKHTAVLGSTGSGKSSTVAAVLHCLLERGVEQEYEKWNPRIVLLDLKLPRFGGHLIIRRRLHMLRPVLQPTPFRILPGSYSQGWSEAAYGYRTLRCSRIRQLATANGLPTSVCQEARFAE